MILDAPQGFVVAVQSDGDLLQFLNAVFGHQEFDAEELVLEEGERFFAQRFVKAF